ncbi:hypothetical protein ACQJBY_020330 [Aegilops geniculata]
MTKLSNFYEDETQQNIVVVKIWQQRCDLCVPFLCGPLYHLFFSNVLNKKGKQSLCRCRDKIRHTPTVRRMVATDQAQGEGRAACHHPPWWWYADLREEEYQ